MTLAAWDWRPDPGPWFDQLIDQRMRWEPSAALRIDGALLRHVIFKAAEAREPWLIHPCMNPLTYPGADERLQRDFQMAVWVALNCSEPIGCVTLLEPTWAWSPGGGAKIMPGSHDLALLSKGLGAGWPDIPIPVDPWSDSTKVAYHQLWRDEKPLSEASRANLQSDLRMCLSAVLKLKEALPACLDWVCSRTKVIVPLRKLSGAHSSSSSSPELRGVVFLTLHHHVQTLEALVHESAHQHLFMAESHGSLVSLNHNDLYKSPLRSDPRPLRGVLLAAHALAYMKNYYIDSIAASLSSPARLVPQLDEISKQYTDARETIGGSYMNFTRIGRQFVDLTLTVGDSGG